MPATRPAHQILLYFTQPVNSVPHATPAVPDARLPERYAIPVPHDRPCVPHANPFQNSKSQLSPFQHGTQRNLLDDELHTCQ